MLFQRMTDTERRVRRVIAEIAYIDKSEVDENTTLSDTGVDSLDLHDIELSLEEEFGFTEDTFGVRLDETISVVAAKVDKVLAERQ